MVIFPLITNNIEKATKKNDEKKATKKITIKTKTKMDAMKGTHLAVLHIMLEKLYNRLVLLPTNEQRILMYYFLGYLLLNSNRYPKLQLTSI